MGKQGRVSNAPLQTHDMHGSHPPTMPREALEDPHGMGITLLTCARRKGLVMYLDLFWSLW
ncbi:MAG: hypothetical protein D6795_10080 [Deltaproteobacteria bacterium]|nr:MAG: hypothetical protein D6795_10080 [Deltaproteobacteria bacterium]